LALNLVKNITRLKFMYIREKNEPAPDDICYPAIEEFERSKRIDSKRRAKAGGRDGDDDDLDEEEKEDQQDDEERDDEQTSDVAMGE